VSKLYDNELYFLVLIYNIIECAYLYVKETGYLNILTKSQRSLKIIILLSVLITDKR